MINKRSSKSMAVKLTCLAIIVAVLSVSLIGCNALWEDFWDAYDNSDIGDFSLRFDESKLEYVAWYISDIGKTKEELVIPRWEYGSFVQRIGAPYGAAYESPNLKKLFWSGNQKFNTTRIIKNCPKLDTVVFTPANPKAYQEFFTKEYCYAFQPTVESGKTIRIIIINEIKKFMISNEDLFYVPDYVVNSPSPNVCYYYNYMTTKNFGYVWIDYLEVGDKIITIPNDPTREDYEFTGWYLDEKCTEKADLQTVVKEDGDISFYAGWKEKEV
ncbi:MAG: InlB B-repeat-containing protein [Clostridia bacterium]|nr:InlB B-repeat-containing protein [Clostridia bacterium]